MNRPKELGLKKKINYWWSFAPNVTFFSKRLLNNFLEGIQKCAIVDIEESQISQNNTGLSQKMKNSNS